MHGSYTAVALAPLTRQYLPEDGLWSTIRDPVERLIVEYEALRPGAGVSDPCS